MGKRWPCRVWVMDVFKHTVPMNKLWHIALTGPTGGGKTNILRLILAQLLRLEAACYLCDIHYAPIKWGLDW